MNGVELTAGEVDRILDAAKQGTEELLSVVSEIVAEYYNAGYEDGYQARDDELEVE